MLVLYSPPHLEHNPTIEYYDGQATPYAERAARITSILEGCRSLGIPIQPIRSKVTARQLHTLHSNHYVDFLQSKCGTIAEGSQLMPSVFIKDTYTPLTKHTYQAACYAAGLAVTAAGLVANAEQKVVYALCRPPGHHAEEDAMMGYCYFNNAALAAERLTKKGKRVAVLDIDYHHGNGTQHLFYDRKDVLYVSVHADPAEAFPYGSGFRNERGLRGGLGFTHNFPLSRSVTPQQYLSTLSQAIRAVQRFEPDFLVLSLGFDTYKDDTIGGLSLEAKNYVTIGNRIAKGISCPSVIVQEGGYNVEMLGVLSAHFLQGYLSIEQ